MFPENSTDSPRNVLAEVSQKYRVFVDWRRPISTRLIFAADVFPLIVVVLSSFVYWESSINVRHIKQAATNARLLQVLLSLVLA